MPKLDAAGCCEVEQDTVGDTGSSARICSRCPCSRGCFGEVCGETCTHPAEDKSEELEGEDRWKELAAALAWSDDLRDDVNVANVAAAAGENWAGANTVAEEVAGEASWTQAKEG